MNRYMKVRQIFIVLIIFISCNSNDNHKKQLEQKKLDSLSEVAFEKASAKYYQEKRLKQKHDSLIDLENVKYDTLYSFINSTIVIKGIIQSSGIHEADQLGVKADFQITNPLRSFFLVTTKDLSPYWGKCVSVKGRFVKGWDADMSKYTFNISAMYLDSIIKISNDYCFNSPVFRPVKNDSYKVLDRDTIVKGVIIRSKRRSPDIDEDYRIELEKPVHNLDDGWGQTKCFYLFLNMNLDSLNNIIEKKRKIILYGNFTGGYIESTYFIGKKVIKTE